MTVIEAVREEVAKYGITLTDSEVEHVVWEKTGFPCFWPDRDKTPEENLRMQVREWAEEQKR